MMQDTKTEAAKKKIIYRDTAKAAVEEPILTKGSSKTPPHTTKTTVTSSVGNRNVDGFKLW